MIVAFTVHNRPHYLAEALESWSKAEYVNSWHAVFSCEPGCPEAVQLCREATFFSGVTVLEQPHHLGVLANPKAVLDHAFYVMGADFAVLAEEDMVVSNDVISYLSFASDVYKDEPKVIAATAAQIDPQRGGPRQVLTVPWFQGWVWGTWADRWALLGPDWDVSYQHKGWDHRIQDYWVGERGFKVAAPALSRVQHIGREGGTHCTPAMFDGLLARGFEPEVDVRPWEYVCDVILRDDLEG